MIITIPQKYNNAGYNLLYEKSCLELLEKQRVSFYPFVREIELILQLINKYGNKLNIKIKYNSCIEKIY